MAAVAHAVAPPHPHTQPHHGHAPLSLMSCVSRAAPSPLTSPRASPRCARANQHQQHQQEEDVRHESKKRSFHPLRGLRRMFRRKRSGESSAARAASAATAAEDEQHPEQAAGGDPGDPQQAGGAATCGGTGTNGAPRSASTGRLLAEGPQHAAGSRTAGGALYPGLSVSHDSVFTADPSDQSGSDTTSTQSIQRLVLPGVRAELVDVLRRRTQRGQGRGPGRGGRGDTSEEDEDLGLPRSPCNSPSDNPLPLPKDQSTCSDGSLLSMGSSDLDEDSCGQSSSRHSSKLSLQDKRSASAEGGDLEVCVSTTPLSHSAARHKMAVKPKRTHGAPRRRRIPQLSAPALPATPELNEDPNGSGRSISPELSTSRIALQRLYPGAPPSSGTALASGKTAVVTVTRSRSSAAARQQQHELEQGAARRSGSSDQLDRDRLEHEQAAAKTKREDLSFFGRLLSRRSGKKKKGERATEQPPAPVLPASASAVPPTSSAYYSVYSAKDAVDAAACSLPTRRLDERGRYVAEVESSHPAGQPSGLPPSGVAPGALTTHFLTKQQQQQQQRPRQRLEPMTLSQRDDEVAAEAEDDDVDVPVTRTTTPLDGVPIPVKPEPAAVAAAAAAAAANRLLVSYSTSPPPPLWPASSAPAAPVETKVVEVIEKTPEARSLFEQQERERESRLRGAARVPGLTAFQQRVAQVPVEEPAFSSLTERRGPPAAQPPSLPAGLGLDTTREREVLRHFDEEMSTISLATSLTASDADGFSGSPDSLEAPAASAPAPVVRDADPPAPPKEEAAATSNTPDGVLDATLDTSEVSLEQAAQTQAQAIGAKGKSASLGSIESVATPPAPSQPPLLKASSSDSLSGTHQMIIPVGTSGLSITQRVEEPERAEPHCVTVACVPDPGTAPAAPNTPTPAAPTSTPSPPTVTLVNLPSPTVSLTPSPTLPDKPTSQHDPLDKPNKDKTEKVDLPAEPLQPGAEQPSPAPRPPALRKSLPPVTAAAAEEAAGVPEFMRVQLNRVDSKPAVNVVLSTASGPERGSRGSLGVIDPWSVEEVAPDASPPAPALLGLRVKRAASKDDVAHPAEAKGKDAAEVAALASSVPSTPLKAQPLQKSASVTVVPQSLIRKQPPPVKRMLSEDNNNVIIVEKKDKKEAAQSPSKANAAEEATAAARRKSASRDSLQLQWQSSLEDKEQRSRDSSISPVLDGVVLRKKSLPREGRDVRDDTPELMKVFARRSLKVRDSEAELTLSTLAQTAQAWESNGSSDQSPPQTPPGTTPNTTPSTTPQTTPQVQQRASRDSDKENEGDSGDSPKVERVSAALASRFQRSVSESHAVQEQLPRPAPPPAEKPAKPAKPVSAAVTGDTVRDTVRDNNNSNRLRTRKADNLITNGNAINNNNNINNNPDKATAVVTPPPVSSVVAKMSARWTLPAEAKQTSPVVTQPTPASDEPEGNPNVGAPAVPKFKRIQQRREEWEQRAKALQRATQ